MPDNGLNIDDLQIKIGIEASKAASGLKDIAKQLRTLANDTSRSAKVLQGVSGSIKDLGKSASAAANQTEKVGGSVEKTGKKAKEAGKNFDKAAKGGLSNFLSTVRRLATYRAIRAALKFLSEAVREGFNMFVTWDREQNNFMAGTARNVDKLSEKWTMLKGQIGALGGALANAVIPIINLVVSGLTKMVDILQMVIRSLQGEYTYYRLIYHEAKATTGQAKELKRVLFGFDELNVLPSANGGGGGVSGGNWAYEEIPINSKFLNGLADLSNKLFGKWEWGKKVLGGIGGAGLIGAIGWLIGGKALGGLLGLLPKLITGFKQKNTSLADQTSKVTADATATQGLATNLGLALGAAGAFSAFLNKNPLNVQVNKPQVDFSDVENGITKAKQFAASNPININVGMAADLTGYARVASFVAMNPISMALSLPTAAVLNAVQTLRNTVQSWFNSNPWRIPIALGKGSAQGYGSTGSKINLGAGALGAAGAASAINLSATDYVNLAESTGLNLTAADRKVAGITATSILSAAFLPLAGMLGSGAMGGSLLKDLLALIPGFATGGTIPNTGSLFYAGEAGAEVVANMGHSTGVMNMSQMQEAVANGNIEVVNAVYAMANMVAGAVNNKNFDVYMDTQKVGQSVSRYQYNQARRGVPQGAI